MKLLLAVILAMLAAGCVTYRHQTVSMVTTGGVCSPATVNGKQGTVCLDCLLCPARGTCWVAGVDGFLQKCPGRK